MTFAGHMVIRQARKMVLRVHPSNVLGAKRGQARKGSDQVAKEEPQELSQGNLER